MHDFDIAKTVVPGEFEAPGCRQQLLEQAGRLLDKAYSGDIIGDNLFLTADGRLVRASVEVILEELSHSTATQGYKSEIEEADICYCAGCNGWFKEAVCPCGAFALSEEEENALDYKDYKFTGTAVTRSDFSTMSVRAPNAEVAKRLLVTGEAGDGDIEEGNSGTIEFEWDGSEPEED